MTHFDATHWPVLSSHLDQLLALGSDEQQAYLASLASSSPDVARQLRRLLENRSSDDFAAFLNEPPAPAATASSQTGQTLGAYVLEHEIGRGGMGTVWRAHRSDGRFEGHVAIKLLNRSLVGHPAEQRFLREGNVLAALRHPNIAYLLDAGVAEHGQPYLVLELVTGSRIDQYCEARALSPRDRIRLFLAVLGAISHAHSHLVIHRDLKPSNILVTDDGTVKLLDFGVAGLLRPEAADAGAPYTLDLMTALTPEFAAPEQLLNEAVTTSTDVYALGLVLFVLLAGRHPHGEAGMSLAERVRTIVEDDAPRLSQTAAAPATARLLRGDLDNIVAKALRRDPAERYVTAEAFAEDLRHYLADEPVAAAPDSLVYRLTKFVARHRRGVAGGAVAVLALVLMGAVAVAQMFEARAQRDNALMEAARANAHGELSEFLLGDSLGLAGNDTIKLKLERAHRLIEKRFAHDPSMEASLLISLSGRYVDIGETDAAASLSRQAETIARQLDDPQLNADIACGRADDSASSGDLPTARRQQAIGRLNMQRLRVVPSGLVAECAMSASSIALLEGDFGKAIGVMQAALQALRNDGVTRSPRYTSIAHEYARSLVRSGDYRRAWQTEREVMAVVTDTGRDDSAGYYAMVNVGATALIQGGQPRKALELIEETIAHARSVSPGWAPPFYLEGSRLMALAESESEQPVADDLDRVAGQAEQQGLQAFADVCRAAALLSRLNHLDLPAAVAQWQLLGVRESELLANPAWWHEAKRMLIEHARLALAQRRPGEAAQLLDRAAGLDPKAHTVSDRDSVRLLLLRADVALADQRYADAERATEQALTLARAQAVDEHASAVVGAALLRRAQTEARQGQVSAAAASAREALRHLDATLDAGSPTLAVARTGACCDDPSERPPRNVQLH